MINKQQIIELIKEELQNVLKEVKATSSFETRGEEARRKGDSERDFVYIANPTTYLDEYPAGGPGGRSHILYTDSPKPELKNKKYAERVEIWKAADPEWGAWYDKNMAIIARQRAGEKVRPDLYFRAWTDSWNAKSKFKGY